MPIAGSGHVLVHCVSNSPTVIAPLRVSLAQVLGNSDSQICNGDRDLPPGLWDAANRYIPTQGIAPMLNGVSAQLRYRHERRLTERGDVGQVVLQDPLSSIATFLDFGDLADLGHRNNAVISLTRRAGADVHGLEDIPRSRLLWPDQSNRTTAR